MNIEQLRLTIYVTPHDLEGTVDIQILISLSHRLFSTAHNIGLFSISWYNSVVKSITYSYQTRGHALLEYCRPVWSLPYLYLIHKLEGVQRSFVIYKAYEVF